MKKIVALLLVLAMAVLCLSACTAKQDAPVEAAEEVTEAAEEAVEETEEAAEEAAEEVEEVAEEAEEAVEETEEAVEEAAEEVVEEAEEVAEEAEEVVEEAAEEVEEAAEEVAEEAEEAVEEVAEEAEEAAEEAEEVVEEAAEEAEEAVEEVAEEAEEAVEETEEAAEEAGEIDMSVAMITDYGDITDQSFNQTTYEACKEFCEEKGIDFTYFKPAGDSDAERVAMIEAAIDEDYNVIVMPGYAFAGAIKETADLYPDVTFIALDVGEGDFGDYELPANLYSAVYQEELCGYMAGYAAVKLGYKHLGFLGGMAVPAVVRYGYGFVQGADAAAAADGLTDVTVEYVYGNQFFGDADITASMDNWYKTLGVECVFACGGGIYSSAAEAAAKVEGGKVIGVDVDQSFIIDGGYGEGMTVTSAMKGLAPTVKTMLGVVADGGFAEFGGKIDTLGLIGEDPDANYVQLPSATTQFAEGFTAEDYAALVADMFNGKITVSNDITVKAADMATTITVNEYDNIK